MEWYTSILPVWQKSVSLARSLRNFVLQTTSKAKWAGESGLSQQMFFASDDGIRLCPHWLNKVLPIHFCLFTIWCKTDFHFSRKSTTIAITDCCTPPEMIGTRLYPWQQFLATLLLCLTSYIFYYSLWKVPDIILVIYLRAFFIHEAADGYMSVSGYPVKFDPITLQAFNAAFESFLLHGIRAGDLAVSQKTVMPLIFFNL